MNRCDKEPRLQRLRLPYNDTKVDRWLGRRTSYVNTGISYELLVQSIFQEILDQQSARTIRVDHDIPLQGRDTHHQIDVYWEFSLGDITYRTVVQARDWQSPIIINRRTSSLLRASWTTFPASRVESLLLELASSEVRRQSRRHIGIKLYLLRPNRQTATLIGISWAEARVDRSTAMMHVVIFRPVVTISWNFAQKQCLPAGYTSLRSSICEMLMGNISERFEMSSRNLFNRCKPRRISQVRSVVRLPNPHISRKYARQTSSTRSGA